MTLPFPFLFIIAICTFFSSSFFSPQQFLTVETARLEVHQQLMDKNEKLALLSVQLGRNEGKHSDTVSTTFKDYFL